MNAPKVLEASSISELSGYVERYFFDDNISTVIYRGHGAKSYKLIPRIGRENPPSKSRRKVVDESQMLELFRRQVSDRSAIPAENDWELLAFAQHHGMATRLLDWTRNPLVALYFAVCRQYEFRHVDGSPRKEAAEVIAWRSPKRDLKKELPESPFEFSGVEKYVPRIVTPRIRVQRGLFTAHSQPSVEFEPIGLTRIRIPYGARERLKRALFRHGIDESVLFPDIDGLARHINYCKLNIY